MAGAYSDVPSRRMAWDQDGTVAMRRFSTDSTRQFTELTGSQMIEMNDEDDVNAFEMSISSYVHYAWLVLIFPELREIDGEFFTEEVDNFGSADQFNTSPDTTNGIDGTWTTQNTDPGPWKSVYPDYRTDIKSLAVASQRAVSVRASKPSSATIGWWKPRALHLYGEISPGETPDRLLFIDATTGLEFNAAGAPEVMDWGDVPRGRADEWTFKLKNNSTVAGNNLTANTVQITHEDLAFGAGSWVTFSDDGSSYSATLQLTSIAPEASTVTLYARQIVPSTAVPGLYASRTKAVVGSWT